MGPESDTQSKSTNLTKLNGYPVAVQEAYKRYLLDNDNHALLTVVLGSLEFMLPHPPAQALVDMPESTRLMEDLGADSLALTELVFLLEELFEVSITNDELVGLRTLGDLKRFSLGKLANTCH